MFALLNEYELALLSDVVEHPSDEVALSIYADWLLDRPTVPEQTRGEHIKVELALIKAKARDEVRDLRWQAHDLWWHHGEGWLGRALTTPSITSSTSVDGCASRYRPRRSRWPTPTKSPRRRPGHWSPMSSFAPATWRCCSYLRQLPRPPLLTELELPPQVIVSDEVGGVDRDRIVGRPDRP